MRLALDMVKTASLIMNKTQEALKMAVEALEWIRYGERTNKQLEAIEACKEALAQPAQEPVLLNVKTHDDKTYKVEVSAPSWQGLSQEEQWNLINKSDIPADYDHEILAIARAIEQALRKRNSNDTK